MHVHASALFGVTVFMFVLLLGTLWRTVAGRIAPTNPALAGAMSAQF